MGGASTPAARPTEARCDQLPRLVERVERGIVRGLSPDVNLVPREPNYIGAAAAPVHSGPWDYLARVPLVMYGPGFVEPGRYKGSADMSDVAPTTARLIGFDFSERDGRVLQQPLVRTTNHPRVVVTVVWDGGGINVLEEHPDSYPFLGSLLRKSATWPDMQIGSSPSVTPPIHATLSTGSYPKHHGIPGLRIRTPDGEYVDPFIGLDPSNMRLPTLADAYDQARDNEPVVGMLAAVNWHLSMIGQGAGRPGGDRDLAVLFDENGDVFSNEALFMLPDIGDTSYLERAAADLDASDGQRDGAWKGNDLSKPLLRYSSPAHVAYQGFLLDRLLEVGNFGRDEIPDLLYVNFKPSDDAGHEWGMTSPEVGDTIRAQDEELERLVENLDRTVGPRRWVLILTADHGQTPYPRESGAWPIGGGELTRDANAALDETDDDIGVVDRVSSPGAYVNMDQLRANELTVGDVARWMSSYTVADNVKEDQEMPSSFEGREDELLFDAAVAEGRTFSEACR